MRRYLPAISSLRIFRKTYVLGMRTSDRIEQQGLDEKEEEADIADGLLVMRRHAIGLKHR